MSDHNPSSVKIQVPATSANLGPGFDSLGLAVSLYLTVELTASEQDRFIYSGNGHVEDTPNNLIHQGFREAYRRVAKVAPKVSLKVHNPIPLARGLGSSSAALVAGVALADKLLDHELGRDDVFQITAAQEGHPDNVAPAIYGGFTVSAQRDDGSYLSQSLAVPEEWQLLFAVPDFELLTSESRAVLPESYSRGDAVYNGSRSALWAMAVALNKPEVLSVASQDKLHEPYREPLIKGMRDCRLAMQDAGAVATYLSGAGPTLAAICLTDDISTACQKAAQSFIGDGGDVHILLPSEGYTYL